MSAKIVHLLRLADTELPVLQSLQSRSVLAASPALSGQSETPISAQVSAPVSTNRPIHDRRKHQRW